MQFQCLIPNFEPPKRFKPNPTLAQKLVIRESLEHKENGRILRNNLAVTQRTTSPRLTTENSSQQKQSSQRLLRQASAVTVNSTMAEDLNLFGGALRIEGAGTYSSEASKSVNDIRPRAQSSSRLLTYNEESQELQKKRPNAFETMLSNQQKLDRAGATTDNEDGNNASASKRQRSETNMGSYSSVQSLNPVSASLLLRQASPAVKPHLTTSSTNRSRNSNTNNKKATSKIKGVSSADFANIKQICRNAGASEAGLQIFLQDVQFTGEIAFALCWEDLSTNHAPSSVKFCTPSSTCSLWYCTCDKNIRADCIDAEHVLGAIIVVKNHESMCYFLPLAPCASSSPAAAGGDPSTSSYKLPLACNTTLEQRITTLTMILNDANIKKVVYNLQVTSIALSQCASVESFKNLVDPRVGQYLLQPDVDDVCFDLGRLFDQYKVEIPMLDPTGLGNVSRVIQKAKMELIFLLRLWPLIEAPMQQKQLLPLSNTIEMPIAALLGQMEQLGVAVDINRLQILRQSVQVQIANITKEIHKLAGTTEFNIASPEQVSHVLFELLKVPVPANIQSNKSNKFTSTSEEVLNKIKDQHPIVNMILTHRALSKIVGTFLEGLQPFLRHDEDTRVTGLATIHASWNQLQVRTGRLSCSKPNLQQVPGNQEVNGQAISVRSLFVARPGYLLLAADYSQIEVRVLAIVSQDHELIRLFQSDSGDIYKLLASKIFNKAVDKIDDEERTRAKTICLGCIYGMGSQAAAAKLGSDVAIVSKITHSFFAHFSGVRSWITRKKNEAKNTAEVKTLSGRLRPLPDIYSQDNAKRAAAERQAVNTVIQGTASDLLKSAMLMVTKILDAMVVNEGDDRRPRLIMQIHDELIFEVPEASPEYLAQVVHALKNEMEQRLVQFWRLQGVPLLTNVSVGRDWGKMQPYMN